MTPLVRVLVVSAILAVVAATGMLLGDGDDGGLQTVRGQPEEQLPAQCLPLPESLRGAKIKSRTPPLPPGSYLSEVLEPVQGAERIAVTVRASLDDFVAFVLERWPDEGWQLGRGEREVGEAEASFVKGASTGFFKARSEYCDKGWTKVFFVLSSPSTRGDAGSRPTPTRS